MHRFEDFHKHFQVNCRIYYFIDIQVFDLLMLDLLPV